MMRIVAGRPEKYLANTQSPSKRDCPPHLNGAKLSHEPSPTRPKHLPGRPARPAAHLYVFASTHRAPHLPLARAPRLHACTIHIHTPRQRFLRAPPTSVPSFSHIPSGLAAPPPPKNINLQTCHEPKSHARIHQPDISNTRIWWVTRLASKPSKNLRFPSTHCLPRYGGQ